MINKTIPPKLLLNPVHCISLGFGSGLSKYAPGTMGTLVAIPLFYLMSELSIVQYGLVTMAALLIGFYCTTRTGQTLGVTDHGAIVWDEVVGYFITMSVIPLNGSGRIVLEYPLYIWILSGFLLFRLFDIWKPWPIKRLEHAFPAGYGVMLDDVLAGIYAAICVQIVIYNIN